MMATERKAGEVLGSTECQVRLVTTRIRYKPRASQCGSLVLSVRVQSSKE